MNWNQIQVTSEYGIQELARVKYIYKHLSPTASKTRCFIRTVEPAWLTVVISKLTFCIQALNVVAMSMVILGQPVNADGSGKHIFLICVGEKCVQRVIASLV